MTIIAAVLSAVLLPNPPAHAEPTVGELDSRLRAATHQLEVVVEQFNDLRVELRATTARSRELGTRTVSFQRAVDDSAAHVGGLAAGLYRRAGSRPAMALLDARSTDQLIGQLSVLDRLSRAQERAVAQLSTAEDRANAAQRNLAALAARQRAQQHRLAAKKKQIERTIAGLRVLRDRAAADGFGQRRYPASASQSPPPYVPGPAGRAVAFAYAQLGKPYRWGASGPDAYDCSGLTSAAWARAGVGLPHSARGQAGAVSRLDRGDLRPGDLIFYYAGISHVALYVGGGRMIHAPQHGEPVRIDTVGFQPVQGYGRPG